MSLETDFLAVSVYPAEAAAGSDVVDIAAVAAPAEAGFWAPKTTTVISSPGPPLVLPPLPGFTAAVAPEAVNVVPPPWPVESLNTSANPLAGSFVPDARVTPMVEKFSPAPPGVNPLASVNVAEKATPLADADVETTLKMGELTAVSAVRAAGSDAPPADDVVTENVLPPLVAALLTPWASTVISSPALVVSPLSASVMDGPGELPFTGHGAFSAPVVSSTTMYSPLNEHSGKVAPAEVSVSVDVPLVSAPVEAKVSV